VTRLRALGVTLILGLVACTASPSPSPSTIYPTSPVEGVVLTVDAAGLVDVRGFTLRTAAGQTLTFKLGTLENATEFAPGHLGEHQATAAPIRVSFRVVDGVLVVYRLEDALAAPS
jgi:hypothetical protein